VIEPAAGAMSQKVMKKVLLALVLFSAGFGAGSWFVFQFWVKGLEVLNWETEKGEQRCQKKLDEFYSKTML